MVNLEGSCLTDSNPGHTHWSPSLLGCDIHSASCPCSQRGTLICWQFRSPFLRGVRLIRKDLTVLLLEADPFSCAVAVGADCKFQEIKCSFSPSVDFQILFTAMSRCFCSAVRKERRKKKKVASRMQSLLLCRRVSVGGVFSHSSKLWKRSSLSTTDKVNRNGDGGWQENRKGKLFLKRMENTLWGKKGRNRIRSALINLPPSHILEDKKS